jgi:hypothetical protein
LPVGHRQEAASNVAQLAISAEMRCICEDPAGS